MDEFSNLLEQIEDTLDDADLISEDMQKCLDSLKKIKSDLEEKIEVSERNAKNLEKEMDEFSNRLDSIQDRLDDADLISEDMQKCLDSLKKIKSDLEEKIEVSERNAKNLEKEKVKVAKSLEAEKEKGLVQKQALGFVKEILTSPLVSDESTVKLYQAIDNIVAFIKEDVQETLKESGQLRDLSDAERQTLFSTDLVAWAITKKKKWIDGKTTIALLGEFSAGKTSILNCILSKSDSSAPQLPVEIRPTTAIPTYISGGLINGYQFVTPNN